MLIHIYDIIKGCTQCPGRVVVDTASTVGHVGHYDTIHT